MSFSTVSLFLVFRNIFQGHTLLSSLGKNVIFIFYVSKMNQAIP